MIVKLNNDIYLVFNGLQYSEFIPSFFVNFMDLIFCKRDFMFFNISLKNYFTLIYIIYGFIYWYNPWLSE